MVNILPPNATPFEKALDEAEHRLLSIPVPIEDLWRPETCPAHLLGYLAWALSVDLWEDDWSIARKRRMCADAIALHRLKGTYEGLRRFLAYVDAEIVQAVLPPQRIFAVPYDPERRAMFRERFQQLRVFPFRLRVDGEWRGAFVDHTYAGFGFAYPNNALSHYGRRAVIWDKGIETPVRWSADRLPNTSAVATTTERIVVPARVGPADASVGRIFAGAAFARSAGPQSRILSLGADLVLNAGSKPEIAGSSGGLRTLDATPERVFQRAPLRGRGFCVGHGFAGHHYARENEAAAKIFDRYYLMNEGRVPRSSGFGFGPFVGQMRVGIKPFSARFRVRRFTTATPRATLVSHSFAGKSHALKQADRFGPVVRAMRAAGMYRDTLYFTTKTRRQAEFSDGISFNANLPFDNIIDIRRDAL